MSFIGQKYFTDNNQNLILAIHDRLGGVHELEDIKARSILDVHEKHIDNMNKSISDTRFVESYYNFTAPNIDCDGLPIKINYLGAFDLYTYAVYQESMNNQQRSYSDFEDNPLRLWLLSRENIISNVIQVTIFKTYISSSISSTNYINGRIVVDSNSASSSYIICASIYKDNKLYILKSSTVSSQNQTYEEIYYDDSDTTYDANSNQYIIPVNSWSSYANNNDTSVTYALYKAQLKQLVDNIFANIDTYIDRLCNNDMALSYKHIGCWDEDMIEYYSDDPTADYSATAQHSPLLHMYCTMPENICIGKKIIINTYKTTIQGLVVKSFVITNTIMPAADNDDKYILDNHSIYNDIYYFALGINSSSTSYKYIYQSIKYYDNNDYIPAGYRVLEDMNLVNKGYYPAHLKICSDFSIYFSRAFLNNYRSVLVLSSVVNNLSDVIYSKLIMNTSGYLYFQNTPDNLYTTTAIDLDFILQRIPIYNALSSRVSSIDYILTQFSNNLIFDGEGLVYQKKNNKAYPVGHPDISTQPSLLPQRFGTKDMYEVVIPCGITTTDIYVGDYVPNNATILECRMFCNDYSISAYAINTPTGWVLNSFTDLEISTLDNWWAIVRYIDNTESGNYYGSVELSEATQTLFEVFDNMPRYITKSEIDTDKYVLRMSVNDWDAKYSATVGHLVNTLVDPNMIIIMTGQGYPQYTYPQTVFQSNYPFIKYKIYKTSYSDYGLTAYDVYYGEVVIRKDIYELYTNSTDNNTQYEAIEFRLKTEDDVICICMKVTDQIYTDSDGHEYYYCYSGTDTDNVIMSKSINIHNVSSIHYEGISGTPQAQMYSSPYLYISHVTMAFDETLNNKNYDVNVYDSGMFYDTVDNTYYKF